MWRAASTHAGVVRHEPRERLLLGHLNLLAFHIPAPLALGLQKEDGRGGVALFDELVKVALCEVESAVVDVLDSLLVLGVVLHPLVVRGASNADRVAGCRHDAERTLEGVKHRLFFGVRLVRF